MMEATVKGDGCRLVLRVSGYERPGEEAGSDANWLRGEVELEAGRTGLFHARHPVALQSEDLARFKDELSAIVGSLNGQASFHHVEAQVGCTVELTNGRGRLTAFVRENIGSELLVSDCDTDQSYLGQTVRDLAAIERAFPVRGT